MYKPTDEELAVETAQVQEEGVTKIQIEQNASLDDPYKRQKNGEIL